MYFLIDLEHQISMAFGTSQQIGIMRGAKFQVVAIQLKSRRTATDEAKITNDFVFPNAFKNPGTFGSLTVFFASIKRRDIEPISRERQPT